MADSSFDIVSKLDHQEVDNALSQAAREISQRYDFKGTGAEIKWSGETRDRDLRERRRPRHARCSTSSRRSWSSGSSR